MSVHKPLQNKDQTHHKGFDYRQNRHHWDAFLSDINKKNATKQVVDAGGNSYCPEEETAEDMRSRLLRDDPTKHARIRDFIDRKKQDVLRREDPHVHYEGDVRISLVTNRSGIRRLLKNAGGLTDAEAITLLQNLEEFPNLRIVYCEWKNASTLTYDH